MLKTRHFDIFLIFVMSICTATSAQFPTGTKSIDGSVQMSSIYLEQNNISTILSLTPSFGYFIFDNIQLFSVLNTNIYWFENARMADIQGGVGAKFYKKVAKTSLYAGSGFYTDGERIIDQLLFEAGALTPLNESVWLDFGLDYQMSTGSSDLHILTLGVGIAIFFLP